MKDFVLLVLTLSFLALINVSYAVKLVPPKDGQIYFGAFPGFADEDQVLASESGNQSKINHLDAIAGKPAMWSYFSNNWLSEIRYP